MEYLLCYLKVYFVLEAVILNVVMMMFFVDVEKRRSSNIYRLAYFTGSFSKCDWSFVR